MAESSKLKKRFHPFKSAVLLVFAIINAFDDAILSLANGLGPTAGGECFVLIYPIVGLLIVSHSVLLLLMPVAAVLDRVRYRVLEVVPEEEQLTRSFNSNKWAWILWIILLLPTANLYSSFLTSLIPNGDP